MSTALINRYLILTRSTTDRYIIVFLTRSQPRRFRYTGNYEQYKYNTDIYPKLIHINRHTRYTPFSIYLPTFIIERQRQTGSVHVWVETFLLLIHDMYSGSVLGGAGLGQLNDHIPTFDAVTTLHKVLYGYHVCMQSNFLFLIWLLPHCNCNTLNIAYRDSVLQFTFVQIQFSQ